MDDMVSATSAGLNSLSGFSFQIKAFILMMTQLTDGKCVEFETLDDVVVRDIPSNDKAHDTGSMARHTLMQLCGYLGFLQMLIKDAKYPLIPMLVIDHISKPFDEKNVNAIGAVLEGIYKYVDKSELQIILFDDKSADRLGLTPDEFTDLLGEGKSGFNPYYYAPVTEEDEEESKESSDSVSTEKTISEEKQEE